MLSTFFGHGAMSQEILSKEDAFSLFNMTFQEWKFNVEQLSKMGVAIYDTQAPLEYTLIADVPFGRVITTPSFPDEMSKPMKLSVSIVHDKPASNLLLTRTSEWLIDYISSIYLEMTPDFTVMTEIYLSDTEGQVISSHQIFVSGRFPVLDETAKQTEGCWKECIVRLD